jgi:16S rRNA G527 N7-methylase RsmG
MHKHDVASIFMKFIPSFINICQFVQNVCVEPGFDNKHIFPFKVEQSAKLSLCDVSTQRAVLKTEASSHFQSLFLSLCYLSS